ncbi:2-phosphosulfolactate phosphatase [Pueribacillus theae]|uniref:Probable 2-phosphosulfolactate phosphatase n=1 Tax=Pueribacillus theae TaxID=2171751 RepID=A0A2U1K5D6_9BACI|nr:2-phosphosulfolactate phosphatase [Pueribacillus theae]PWA12475.1 2-phosphosulfolactate phosphatase [Pueribacillus theae]
MGKIDLLLKKEEINDNIMNNNIAVVFDILLATSTASAMFYYGAKEIIPVLDGKEALKLAEKQADDNFMLVGEHLGITIEGFLDPIPTRLKDKVKGKRVIFSTTNGTVALKNSWAAKAVYAASILNEEILANHLMNEYGADSYMLVCSGSSEKFNLEDLYGAGSFIENLIQAGETQGIDWEMSDSALAALHFYKGNKENGEQLLKASRVGRKLVNEGHGEDVEYILKKNACPVISRLEGESLRRIDAIGVSE